MNWKNVGIGAGIGSALGAFSPSNLVFPGLGTIDGALFGGTLGALTSGINSGAKSASANGDNELADFINGERNFNSAEAQKERDWQEYMSSTAIQRQVNDLKSAGLNPWLALQGGINGAASGSGASATSSSASAMAYMKSTKLNNFTKLITSGVTNVTNSALSVLNGLLGIASKL